MLVNEVSANYLLPKGVIVMTDVVMITQSVQTILFEIAKQTQVLGTGLQNAAPGDKENLPPSIQYLFEVSEYLKQQAAACEKLSRSFQRSAL